MTAGTELDMQAVDGLLEIVAPSRVRAEACPHGVRFTADEAGRASAEAVRQLTERGRP